MRDLTTPAGALGERVFEESVRRGPFFPDGRGADSVRLSFSLVDEASIDDGIERLGSILAR